MYRSGDDHAAIAAEYVTDHRAPGDLSKLVIMVLSFVLEHSEGRQ